MDDFEKADLDQGGLNIQQFPGTCKPGDEVFISPWYILKLSACGRNFSGILHIYIHKSVLLGAFPFGQMVPFFSP